MLQLHLSIVFFSLCSFLFCDGSQLDLLTHFTQPRTKPGNPTTIGANVKPLKLAVIGSTSNFACKAHFPSLKSLTHLFKIVATWSYSKKADSESENSKCQNFIPDNVTHHMGVPGWKELLQNSDINTLDIILPIHVQAKYVAEGLEAGKHVISEKPILSASQEIASNATNDYQKILLPYIDKKTTDTASISPIPKPVWSVSENWRFEPSYERLLQMLRNSNDILSSVDYVDIKTQSYIPSDHQLLAIGWRGKGESSLWIDIAVHYAAVIRSLLSTLADSSSSKDDKRDEQLICEKEDGDCGKGSSNSITKSSIDVKNFIRYVQKSGRTVNGFIPFDTATTIFSIPLLGTKSKKTITVVWTNSFQIRENLFYERNPTKTAMSNMLIKLQYNNTEHINVDRWYVSGSQLKVDSDKTNVKTYLGKEEPVFEIPNEFSVERSLEDFALAILDPSSSTLINTPNEALLDLEFIETIASIAI